MGCGGTLSSPRNTRLILIQIRGDTTTSQTLTAHSRTEMRQSVLQLYVYENGTVCVHDGRTFEKQCLPFDVVTQRGPIHLHYYT